MRGIHIATELPVFISYMVFVHPLLDFNTCFSAKVDPCSQMLTLIRRESPAGERLVQTGNEQCIDQADFVQWLLTRPDGQLSGWCAKRYKQMPLRILHYRFCVSCCNSFVRQPAVLM